MDLGPGQVERDIIKGQLRRPSEYFWIFSIEGEEQIVLLNLPLTLHYDKVSGLLDDLCKLSVLLKLSTLL